MLHAQIAHHCTRLPKGPAVLLLEGRQPAVRVLAAILRIVVASELAAPVDTLVRDTEFTNAPHRFDDVRAVGSPPYLQHAVVPFTNCPSIQSHRSFLDQAAVTQT